jgi:poly-gamma-glutamate capsule biosynthesis protein CapA/YwtB (metallophosphatase superfamily)
MSQDLVLEQTMKIYSVKIKAVFFLISSALLFSGCVNSVDLGKQAQEQKSFSSMQGSADLSIETTEVSNARTSNPVKILFVGDMMFDRSIREAVEKYGKNDYSYIFELLKEKLSGYDLVAGNLEGPITDKESVSVNTKMDERNNFVFTFDPAVAKVLFDNNIKLVNLGNNHILNKGETGIEQTKKYLDVAGVQYFDEGLAFVKEINGMKIGFVSYNYSVPDSIEAAIENIKLAKKQSDVVIAFPHWGTEYKVGDPGEAIRALAHRFIDAGADAIIGTHPHVIEDSEIYNGKKIYYSLGNFIFDQYFQKETMEGLGVEMIINPDRSKEYSELKFEMTKRGQTIFKAKP